MMSVPLKIDNYDINEFVRLAANFGSDKFGYVVTPNVDHLIRLHDEPLFRALYSEAAYVLLDSRFLSFLFALTQGVRPKVCTGSDLTAQLFEGVIKPDDPVVLIGAEPEQAAALVARYGVRCMRHFNPPMGFIHDASAIEDCLEFIESQGAFRFCLLAVGAPQQEVLAQRLKARGRARGLALCVGASINFLTGVERRAPRWMQRMGAEWLFRLALDPQRLARRYLVRGPRVFGLLSHTNLILRPPIAAAMPSNLATGEIHSRMLF